ncbi:MAG: LamG-like jellyroll fold domain-containing protein [Bacteroidales bacterium]|nr:LamG-like jellyroll fold domain-containing protein [Bacteroidales bacterium]
MVFTESGIKGYVDGTLRCSSTTTQGTETAPSASLQMGGPLEPRNTFLKGALDEVRLYKKALSESEIETLR